MKSELEIMGISRIALEIIISETGWKFLFGFFFFVHREELKRKKQTKIPSCFRNNNF